MITCTGPSCPLCAQGGWTVSRPRWAWMRLCATLAVWRDRVRVLGHRIVSGAQG